MRSIKKIFALLLVVMMLFAVAVISSSAEEGDYTEAAQRLSNIDVLKGDTSGNLMLDQGVTRYQAALFFVQALTGETEVEKWNADKQSTVFSDVPEYATAIDYAYGIGLILGRGNGVYGYNDPITYQDMLVMAVRALGYETETTVYPYGYIDVAKKLELTENVSKDIKYTDALTRGATAQIIWNMLNTEIAVVDPITSEIIYPNDFAAVERLLRLLDIDLERTILLEEAGFSLGVIEGTVVEFVEAESSKDVDIVIVDAGEVEYEIAADDLGITTRTNRDTYLGLPITVYIDCKVEDFEQNYDVYEEENDATIIFSEMFEYVNVVNAGVGGNIKVVEDDGEYRVTLGDVTYRDSKCEFELRVFTEDGWVEEDFDVFCEAFLYGKKDYIGTNSYGEVDYTVYTEEVDDDVITNVMILYKPYEFGQYFTRSIRYQPTVTDESFITIGKYNAGAVDAGYENKDDDNSYFVETVLGSDVVVDSELISISKEDGEAAKDAKLSGESVRNGDFIFYYYNEVDNVLEIGYNCGSLKSGDLTSYSKTRETVKIDSTNYTFGFEGVFESDLPTFDDFDFGVDFIQNVDVDDKNVQYVAVGSNVVYVQKPLNTSNHRVKHNYAIITTDPETMAELLDLEYKETDDGEMDPYCAYAKKLTDDGVYVSDNGNMTVAMLNTTSGKWALAEVAQYEYGTLRSTTGLYHNDYDHEDAEWENVVDIADGIKKYDIFGDNFKGYDEYSLARDILLDGGMFAIRGNNSGVYDLSVMFHPDDWGMINNGKVLDGLYFSDVAPKTNDIIATRAASAEPARVTLTDSTVIVVVGRDSEGHNQVGVRVGIQGEENSIVFNGLSSSVPAYFYSATNKLIVLQLPLGVSVNMNTAVTDINGDPFDIKAWEDAPSSDTAETYYIATNGAGIEYEKLDDDTYDVTVYGLFNLRTMRAVSAIKVNVPDIDDTNLIDDFVTGAILHMEESGDLVISDADVEEALLLASDLRETDDDDFETVDMREVEFLDEDSITIEELGLDKEIAVGSINMTVATVDITDLKTEKYDLKKIAYPEAYDIDNAWKAGTIALAKNEPVYAYNISDLNTADTISAPTAGVLNQYIIDTVGEILYIAEVDSDYFENRAEIYVDLYACAQFDDKTGDLTIYVVKLVCEN